MGKVFGELITDRLVLKCLNGDYAERVTEYYLRNQNFLKPWEPWRRADFYTILYQLRDMQNQWYLINKGELVKYWIFLKEDREFQKVLGLVSLNDIAGSPHHTCFIGYALDQAEGKKGYMKEAVKAVLDYAFRELELNRIEANIMPHNLDSLKVAKKLGFELSGQMNRFLQIDGQWQEHLCLVRYRS